MANLFRTFLALGIFLMASAVDTDADQEASGSLQLSASYCAYRLEGDSTGSYIEIYFNLLRGQLKFQPDTSGYVAIIDFRIAVRDTGGVLIDSASWRAGSRIKDLSALEDSDFLISDMVAEVFPVGKYAITLSAINDTQKGICSFDMDVPPFSSEKLDISWLELAYEITPDSTGKFLKAGHRILPNPSGRFMQGSGVVYIYAEAYNLDTSPEAESTYSVSLSILDLNGENIKSIRPTIYPKPGSSAAILTGFSTATLDRGLYKIKLILTDGAESASAERGFTLVASPGRLRQEKLQAILKMFPQASRIDSEEDAEKFRCDIAHIATPQELKLYDSLNLQGKSNFQKDFWTYRDPDPDTPENEFQLEHYRRLKYAEDKFGQYKGFIPGWKTDQGRVFILYGEPSDIERYHPSIEERAWERWWYHGIEGGVYFIFVDFEDTGAYILVHSSMRNEVKDYNWQDKVKMTLFQR
jgi:GWxTD domain-containing protein